MEESEKRKERLRAMRMEAAQAEVCSNAESFVMPYSLSNPLVENPATQQTQEQSYGTPRFDFYTDPMSAFSANKKRGQPDNQIRQDYFTPPNYSASAMARPLSPIPEPRHFEMAPSLAHQLQSSSSFDQRMYQAQGPYNNAVAHGSSRGTASPLTMYQGTPEAWNRSQATTGHYNSATHGNRNPRGMVSPFPTIDQGTPESWNGSGGTASPLPMYQGTPEAWNRSQATTGYYNSATHGNRNPRGMASPFPTIDQGTPESWNGSGGTARYDSPSNLSGGGQFFSPSFRPVRSPTFGYGQGRPHWQGSNLSPGLGRGGSPGPSTGRGSGRWYGGSMSPGLGRSGGRGRGHHHRGLGAEGRQGPECFYHRSMDENPWQQLEPLVWKSRSLKGPGPSNSWLPKSIIMKKARVSETFNQSSSQPSLAEYLAASFNEVTNDTSNS